jgi:hypothetical protein
MSGIILAELEMGKEIGKLLADLKVGHYTGLLG